MNTLKTYITAGLATIIFGMAVAGYFGYSHLTEKITQAESQASQAILDRDKIKGANDTNLKTIETLKAEKRALELAQSTNTENELVAEEKVKEKIVFIDRVVKLDPVTNTRDLSPVLKSAITLIQKDWSESK